MDVRAAEDADIDHLPQHWYDGWQDAHAANPPSRTVAGTNLGEFSAGATANLAGVRVAGPSTRVTVKTSPRG
jgi:hypothetical protein